MAGGPKVGDAAPDFTLPGTKGGPHTLSSFKGRPVVLAFYPGDDTPVCTTQLKSYDHDLAAFEEIGAQLLAISPQSVESHEKFSCKAGGDGGFGFPLLADVDKAVFKAYGCLGPLGFPRRSVFVIDAEGVVRYAHRAAAGLTYRKTTELVEVLEAL